MDINFRSPEQGFPFFSKLKDMVDAVSSNLSSYISSQLSSITTTALTSSQSSLGAATADSLEVTNTVGTATTVLDKLNAISGVFQSFKVTGLADLDSVSVAAGQGPLSAGDIDVKNIKCGPTIRFTKSNPTYNMCNNTFLLARLDRDLLPTGVPGPIKPAIVFVWNSTGTSVQACIHCTEKELVVLYSKDPAFTTLTFGVYKAVVNGVEEFYVGLRSIPVTQIQNAQVRVACINAVSDPASPGQITTVHELDCTLDSAFAGTNAIFNNSTVNNLILTSLTAVDLTVTGNTNLQGPVVIDNSVQHTGSWDTNGTINATLVTGDEVGSDHFVDQAGHEIISVDEANSIVHVGASNHHTDLRGIDRPTSTWQGISYDIAMLQDVSSGIEFQRVVDFACSDPAFLPTNAVIDLKSGTQHDVGLGPLEALVFIDPVTSGQNAQYYSGTVDPSTKDITWTAGSTVPIPSNHETYLWLGITTGDPHTPGTDGKWTSDSSSLYWHPDRTPFWSINQSSMFGYLNAQQVMAMINAIMALLSSHTPDWLENQQFITDPISGVQMNNPAFIQNKPLTGFSLLRGRNYDSPAPVGYPEWVVKGHDYNSGPVVIPSSAQTGQEFQNTVVSVDHGSETNITADSNKLYSNAWTDDTKKWIIQEPVNTANPQIQIQPGLMVVNKATKWSGTEDANFKPISNRPQVISSADLFPDSQGYLFKFMVDDPSGSVTTNTSAFSSVDASVDHAVTTSPSGRVSAVDLSVQRVSELGITKTPASATDAGQIMFTWSQNPGDHTASSLATLSDKTIYSNKFVVDISTSGETLIDLNGNPISDVSLDEDSVSGKFTLNKTQSGVTTPVFTEDHLDVVHFKAGAGTNPPVLTSEIPDPPKPGNYSKFFLSYDDDPTAPKYEWIEQPIVADSIVLNTPLTSDQQAHTGILVDITSHVDITSAPGLPVNWQYLRSASSDPSKGTIDIDPLLKTITIRIDPTAVPGDTFYFEIGALPSVFSGATVAYLQIPVVVTSVFATSFEWDDALLTTKVLDLGNHVLVFNSDGPMGVNWPYYDNTPDLVLGAPQSQTVNPVIDYGLTGEFRVNFIPDPSVTYNSLISSTFNDPNASSFSRDIRIANHATSVNVSGYTTGPVLHPVGPVTDNLSWTSQLAGSNNPVTDDLSFIVTVQPATGALSNTVIDQTAGTFTYDLTGTTGDTYQFILEFTNPVTGLVTASVTINGEIS